MVTRGQGSEGFAIDEARLRQLFRQLPAQVALIDRDFRIVWVNRFPPSHSPEQVIGQPIDPFVHPDDLPRARAGIERAFQTGADTYYEARGYSDGRASAWVGITVVPQLTEDPARATALLVSWDITKQQLAERALHEGERRFWSLTESLPQVVVIVDPSMHVTTVNRDPVTAGGISRDAVIGKHLSDLVHADDVAVAIARIQRCLDTGEATTYEARGRGVPQRVYSCRAIRVVDGAGASPRALIAATDVSERRDHERERAALERQLHQAQKLETMGRLAGGIAHDFNNILLVVQSQLEFAQRALETGGDVAAELAEIGSATDKASEVIRRLLTIGRRQPTRRTHVDLSALVQEMQTLIRRALPTSVELDVRCAGGPIWLHADRSQLEQVLLNLCINAGDAIEETGRVSIEVSRDAAGARLVVSDTGTGMPEGVAAQAFEPFFTTKAPGKGSGLGLSMVQSIVAQNDGHVVLQTREGEGATFEIRLPLAEPPTVASAVCAAPAPTPERAATILLAEDEPSVRAVVQRILERAGYRVIAARDGQQAVEYFVAHQREIDLVVLDAVMPRLTGREAYERIHALRPDTRVLFSSGYAADALPDAFLRTHPVPVLPKPYHPSHLLEAVARLLAGRGDGDLLSLSDGS